MKKFVDEFSQFAMRGNVMDLAIGVIIGASFNEIVSSLVSDIIMPPFGLLFGGIKFSNFFFNLTNKHIYTLQEAQQSNVPVIAYGNFIDAIIQFIIVAFAIFIFVKQINRLFPKKTASKTDSRLCPYCYQPIHKDATRCPHCTSILNKKNTAENINMLTDK